MADVKQQVMAVLATIKDPEIGRDLVTLNMVRGVAVAGGSVTIDIDLTTPACPLKEQIGREVKEKVGAIPGVAGVTVNFGAQVREQPRAGAALSGVKHIVAVGSGKGGVGKSTVAANIALSLAAEGATVGLMDLDVYGPSIPLIMGIQGARPEASPEGKIVPIERLGLKIISFGFFMPASEAMIVRGPILAGIVKQFLNDVDWGKLDYMVIDLPPGTGDIQLSLAQMIPLTGAVVVTTPQDVALLVATKAIAMFRKLNTPILGLIENMSSFICPHCHKTTDIFGHGGARTAALNMNIPFLGEVPLDAAIRFAENDGIPIVRAKPDSLQSQAFREAARLMAGRISMRALGTEGGDDLDRVMAKAATLFRQAGV